MKLWVLLPTVWASEAFSNHKTTCGWKGLASYYSINVNGDVNPDAVWYYAEPKPEAANIRDRVAFWKGVKVS